MGGRLPSPDATGLRCYDSERGKPPAPLGELLPPSADRLGIENAFRGALIQLIDRQQHEVNPGGSSFRKGDLAFRANLAEAAFLQSRRVRPSLTGARNIRRLLEGAQQGPQRQEKPA